MLSTAARAVARAPASTSTPDHPGATNAAAACARSLALVSVSAAATAVSSAATVPASHARTQRTCPFIFIQRHFTNWMGGRFTFFYLSANTRDPPTQPFCTDTQPHEKPVPFHCNPLTLRPVPKNKGCLGRLKTRKKKKNEQPYRFRTSARFSKNAARRSTLRLLCTLLRFTPQHAPCLSINHVRGEALCRGARRPAGSARARTPIAQFAPPNLVPTSPLPPPTAPCVRSRW